MYYEKKDNRYIIKSVTPAENTTTPGTLKNISQYLGYHIYRIGAAFISILNFKSPEKPDQCDQQRSKKSQKSNPPSP